jgi:hypothetical protein
MVGGVLAGESMQGTRASGPAWREAMLATGVQALATRKNVGAGRAGKPSRRTATARRKTSGHAWRLSASAHGDAQKRGSPGDGKQRIGQKFGGKGKGILVGIFGAKEGDLSSDLGARVWGGGRREGERPLNRPRW